MHTHAHGAVKADLHTHSIASPDGSLALADYEHALRSGLLDCVAVTDHNEISFAVEAQRALGKDKVIVGEEITTRDGEIIGLYLTKRVEPGQSAAATVQAIRKQGGLVYIPHPFETLRKGLAAETLEQIADEVDIIEIHNGRAVFQNRSDRACEWSAAHQVPGAASSDAHGRAGWGRTYSVLEHMPVRDTLAPLLVRATYRRAFPGVRGISYPKFNRLRKALRSYA
jgi:predicted metal-dependent phosphoesterase TrpH